MSLLPNNDLQNIPRKFITYIHQSQRRNSITRNQLCPCGSGKKYKHCHIDKPFKRAWFMRKPFIWFIWLSNKFRSRVAWLKSLTN